MVGRKVNVNVAIDGSAKARIVEMNASITRRGFRGVDFSAGAIPHVTLLMGNLKDGVTLDELGSSVSAVAESFEAFEYLFSPPVLASPGNKFCFLNIVNPTLLFLLKRRLAEGLHALLEFDRHGGPDNPPHATIGYFHVPQKQLPRDLMRPVQGPVRASTIQISSVGSYGTCTAILRSFKLSCHQ